MKITFTRQDAALFIKLILHFNPNFLGKRVSPAQCRLMSCGRMKPTPAVLTALHLTAIPGGYQWQLPQSTKDVHSRRRRRTA